MRPTIADEPTQWPFPLPASSVHQHARDVTFKTLDMDGKTLIAIASWSDFMRFIWLLGDPNSDSCLQPHRPLPCKTPSARYSPFIESRNFIPYNRCQSSDRLFEPAIAFDPPSSITARPRSKLVTPSRGYLGKPPPSHLEVAAGRAPTAVDSAIKSASSRNARNAVTTVWAIIGVELFRAGAAMGRNGFG